MLFKLATFLLSFCFLAALCVVAAFGQQTGIMPTVNDPDFVVERFIYDIPDSPTAMAFLNDSDILVLQKNDGQVRLIRDGVLQPEPVLDANVANAQEQGMLGIAVVGAAAAADSATVAVYLYFTESSEEEGDGGEATGRRVYRYDWTGSELANPVLVRDMNSTRAYHNGGAMAVGPDGTVYLVVGDAGRYGQLQNHGPDSTYYPDTSAIIPVAPEGPYYAMGIRNSFGIAFDPYTGNMWSTENGNEDFDEINLVEPYTNSGWEMIMGPATEEQLARLPAYQNYTYRDPVFSWESPVAPTALSFVRSEPLARFNDSLFVGDCNYGRLYKFTLNSERDGFVFETPELAANNVANRGDPVQEIVFGQDFGCITDIKLGPDGLLYVVSFSEGVVFRLVPEEMAAASDAAEQQSTLTASEIAIYAGVIIVVATAVTVATAIYKAKLHQRNRLKNNNSK